MILTKIDVLDDFDTIQVCTGYRYKGKIHQEMPASLDILENCEPVYTEFKGWKQKTAGMDSLNEFPDNAKRYIDGLQDLLGVGFMIMQSRNMFLPAQMFAGIFLLGMIGVGTDRLIRFALDRLMSRYMMTLNSDVGTP